MMIPSFQPSLCVWLVILVGCCRIVAGFSTPWIKHSQQQLNLGYGAQAQRKVHGRFLHITDIHPDPFYESGSDADQACHEGTPGEPGPYGNPGHYGAPVTSCDSPFSLVNATFDWINTNLKDNIDFIIWTGDNVRHDNDNKFPRTESQIFWLNEIISNKFLDIFGSKDPLEPTLIPIVPTLGNNDVYPHNLFAGGPTLQTRELYRIWERFIPQEQLHIFDRGSYFMSEVIPNKLAVISLNTLYFYRPNPVVDGCDRRKDPGYAQIRWLGIVLQELRERGMKVWLAGHVPPVPKNYDDSCLDKLSAWIHEYRDIIIGGLYGHMNIDHFVFLDAEPASRPKPASLEDYSAWGEFDDGLAHNFGGKVRYMDSIRETYADLDDTTDEDIINRYSISHINPSVIPTYFPGFRVWEYNVTGLKYGDTGVYEDGTPFKSWEKIFEQLDKEEQEEIAHEDEEETSNELYGIEDDDFKAENDDDFSESKKKKKKKKKKKADKTWPPRFENVAPGPGYQEQLFTPTRYIQYSANLTAINLGEKKFDYEVEYSTENEPYNMESLILTNWYKFGKILSAEINAESKKDKKLLKKSRELWNVYLNRAFVGSGYQNTEDN